MNVDAMALYIELNGCQTAQTCQISSPFFVPARVPWQNVS